jgi:hypothetical protein
MKAKRHTGEAAGGREGGRDKNGEEGGGADDLEEICKMWTVNL